MNKRQRFIASCCNPFYGGFANRDEVREAKKLARGKYWLEDLKFGRSDGEDHDTFCAFSSTGKRYYFCFNWFSWGTKRQKTRWEQEVRKACRLWCKGKYKDAFRVYNESYENADN